MPIMTARDVNRLLAIYFYSRFGWNISSILGSDPMVDRTLTSSLPRRLEIMIDVGSCLCVLTELERAAIFYRWNLLASRDEEDANETNVTMEASAALRSGLPQKYDQLMKIAEWHRNSAENYKQEARKQEKRKDYLRAMDRVKVEMAVRDIYARALCGDKVGIGA